MPLPATDNFNRANGALGSNWTGSVGGDLNIVSNQVTGAGAGDNSMYWSADLPDANQYVQVTHTTVLGYAGVVCRASATDWVSLVAQKDINNWEIQWYNGGAWTVIGAAYTAAPTNGNIGKIEAEGSTFRGFVNGTQRISGSNASAPSSGYGGIYVYNSNADYVDDFEVGNLSGGGAASHTFKESGEFPAGTSTTTANPVTTSFTCSSGTTVLVLMVWYAGSTDRTGGAPTYNGVELVLIDGPRRAATSPETTIEMWRMLAPPTGASYTISVPNSNTRTAKLWMATFASSTGASVLNGTTWAQGTSTNPANSITTTANGCAVVALVGSGANTWAPTGRTGVQLYDRDTGNYGGGCQYALPATAGTQATNWTFGTSEDWVIITAAFQPVTIVSFAAVVQASTATPDTASLPVLRSASGAAQAATLTPDSPLSILRAINGLASAITYTPDDANLTVTSGGGPVYFSASALLASVTSDNIIWSVQRSVQAIIQTGSLAPDNTTLKIQRNVQSQAALSTSAPDSISLAILRATQATISAATATPNSTLAVTRNAQAVIQAASNTPTGITLTVLRSINSLALIASNTQDNADLSLSAIIALAATCQAISATSSGSLSISRSLSSAAQPASHTPDSQLSVLRQLIGAALIISTTPDNGKLSISRSLSSAAQPASHTPDSQLSVLRRLISTASIISTTPDNTILSLPGIIDFAAACQLLTITPDITRLAVSRPLNSTAQIASSAPDIARLAVSRPLNSIAQMASATPDITVLTIIYLLTTLILLQSFTPNNASLKVDVPGSYAVSGVRLGMHIGIDLGKRRGGS